MNKNIKDRSLLINIADKMRMIDQDIWAKYIVKQVGDNPYCVIDDLRFQNELDILEKDDDWIYIILQIYYSFPMIVVPMPMPVHLAAFLPGILAALPDAPFTAPLVVSSSLLHHLICY